MMHVKNMNLLPAENLLEETYGLPPPFSDKNVSSKGGRDEATCQRPRGCGSRLRSLPVDVRSSGDVIVYPKVLFGEVWIISGQSNAAFTLGMMATGAGVLAANATAEIAGSAQFNRSIRLLNTGNTHSPTPEPTLPSSGGLPWSRPSPEVLAGSSVMGNAAFSATGWFFARQLNRELEVPIGMVMATMGGTALESWMSAELLYGNSGGAPPDPTKGACPSDPADPTTAIPANSFSPPSSNYNADIAPLFNMTVRGVTWYQGESNEVVGMNATYACRFGVMMADWSRQWHEGTGGATDATLPFGYVQIGTDCGK